MYSAPSPREPEPASREASRDVLLMQNFDLISIIGGFFAVMLVIQPGDRRLQAFLCRTAGGPFPAPLNFLGIVRRRLRGGSGRRLPAAPADPRGSGILRFGGYFPGTFGGSCFLLHNFGLAGAAAAAATADTPAVAGGPGINGQVALIASIVILFVIGFSPKNRRADSAFGGKRTLAFGKREMISL